MSFLSFIGGVLVVVALIAIYYIDFVHPYSPNTIFMKLMNEYHEVKEGRISYLAFRERMKNECSLIMKKDPMDMIHFKQELLSMLEYDDFMQQALSDPDLTMHKLQEKWRSFDPSVPVPKDEAIPKEFASGPGKEVMDMMVEHGYCAPSTLEWVYEGENSSYLMAMFADAIGRHLKFKGKRWKPFIQVWRDKNFPDLLTKAAECGNVDNLGLKVKELFPEYKVPEPYGMK